MLTRWIIRHRDVAAVEYMRQRRLCRERNGNAINLKQSERLLARWEAVLAAWTRNGTR